nr:MAG TPA: minor head component F [Caudoviricetes sp.]
MDLNRLIYSSCTLICKEIQRYIKKENDKLADILKKSGYIDVDYTLSESEKLEDKLSKILQEQTDAFIALLEENPNATISEIVDMLPDFNADTSILNSVQSLFKNEFADTIPKITTAYVHSIDDELEIKHMTNRTSAWINSWSQDLAEIMQVTSEEKLDKILSVALDEGKSIATVAQELKDVNVLNSTTRARTTALTEMLRANSVSAQEAYIQSPAVSEKKWRHTGARKNNPRDNHVRMNGQIVPVDEPFELIGANGNTYYPMYPRDTILPPSESVNCHCIHQPIVDKDVLGLSLKEREKLQNKCIKADNKSWKKEEKELDNVAENGI